ncbi:MAG TPA: tRNA pseudouridine(38-40) synthase TruA [Cytophagales bacterium]|nr:tRNA pseudouridine(38-40) synthase TruA [Cytophagales bacterium]
MAQRYFFEVSYAGTHYVGSQVQPNGRTIQGELETALGKFMPGEVRITLSGRTDTGVHGRQWFHLDSDRELTMYETGHKLNRMLPPDIAIHQVVPVSGEAHARFTATQRHYAYRVVSQKDPFQREFATLFGQPLDVATMNRAALHLLDWEDFECFSKVKTDVSTFICNISRAEWVDTGNGLLTFYVSANRFLRGMVRAIVGTLWEVGLGRCSEVEFRQILESKDRNRAGRAAPAEGLTLEAVDYPAHIFEIREQA